MKRVTLKLCSALLGILGFASCGSTKGASSNNGDGQQTTQQMDSVYVEPTSRVRVMYGPNPATYLKVEETAGKTNAAQ